MLRGNVWAAVIKTDGPNVALLPNRWIKPRRIGHCIRHNVLAGNVMVDSSVTSIRPKLDERMSVRDFGSGPVICGKEQEAWERHAPEEMGPHRQARLIPLTSHGSSRCFLTGDMLAHELIAIAAGSTRGPELQPTRQGYHG